MKMLLTITLALFALTACGKGTDPADFADLFTQRDAERILGEPAHISEGEGRMEGNGTWYKAAFVANDTDKVSAKLGAIYYLVEQYPDTSAAQGKYVAIFEANSGHEGIKTLKGLGDEAYFHSDGTNFIFIMARKGKNVLTMKVNKLTSKTSRKAFDDVAKKLMSKL